MPGQTVHVHAIHASRIDPVPAAGLLTHDERAEAGRFIHKDHQIRWLRFRAATRIVLGHATGCHPGELRIRRTPEGKPELVGPPAPVHFNLSHCGDFGLLAWSSAGPVGIDVEADSRAAGLESCFPSITSGEERTAWTSAQEADSGLAMLDLWTAKEAWLKAWGIGFAVEPSDLTITWSPGGAGSGHLAAGLEAPPWNINLRRLPSEWMPGHRATLALAGSPADPVFHPFVPESFFSVPPLCPA